MSLPHRDLTVASAPSYPRHEPEEENPLRSHKKTFEYQVSEPRETFYATKGSLQNPNSSPRHVPSNSQTSNNIFVDADDLFSGSPISFSVSPIQNSNSLSSSPGLIPGT